MKRIINGKRYNTETAEEISSKTGGGNPSNFGYFEESLYKTKRGNYFLHGRGGPSSKYAENNPNGGTDSGAGLEPLSEEETIVWLESNSDYELLEKLFPDSVVDA